MDESRAHSSKDLLIRAADTADAPHIVACLEAAFAPYRDLYTPAAYTDTVPQTDGILRRIKGMRVLVALAGDQVVGTIAGSLDDRGEGHLRGMAVLPQWQGSGIAGQLLVAIEDYLRAQGCRRVTLDTTLPLQRAIRSYQSHGYRPSGVTADFFGMSLHEFAKDL
jgi:GNAT superfamily N-acetyltransferase